MTLPLPLLLLRHIDQEETPPGPRRRQRVVIVGAGFAGFHAARRLARLAKHTAGVEVVLINPTDYFLYLALLPEVAGGIVDPRHIAVPLQSALPGVRVLLGTVDRVDLHRRQVGLVDSEGRRRTLAYDRLLLAVVGADYTGTEVAAHGQLLTRQAARQHPGLRGQRLRWLLVDLAPRVLPELDRRLSAAAHRTLTGRGVEILSGTSITEATSDGVRLSDGQFVLTRSLIWCVGVRPDPLVERLGLPTSRGRLLVDEYLAVPGHPEVFACGDLAAVPDLTRPGQLTPMTAQHAVRQGRLAAGNLAALLGHGRRRAYRHRDLGFVVDLAGAKAAANPLGVPLSGQPAKAVTRGYHLAAVPAYRARIACDWLLDAVLARQAVQFGLVRAAAVPLGVDSLNPRSGPPPPTGQPHPDSMESTANEHLPVTTPAAGSLEPAGRTTTAARSRSDATAPR